MTTRQFKTRTNSVERLDSVRRTAFTLVELMIVIVIIGILAGIAVPVVNGALRRAKEFTIENEVQQMGAAIDKFETQHGFFPPTFGVGGAITSQAEFLRYLNRIAPNHAETSSGGLTQWWNQVGSQLDERSSLVFWLSGLCTSKQYPLSGTAAIASSGTPLAPYDSNKLVDDSDIGGPNLITRETFFEFKAGQLVNAGGSLAAGIKAYTQPEGKSSGDLAYRYLDKSAYASGAYFNGAGFFNPETFQIVAPGLDGSLSNATSPVVNLSDSTDVDPAQDDNITNFSGGRLERSYDE